MKTTITLLLLFTLANTCIAQVDAGRQLNGSDCTKQWQYFDLKSKTTGKVIFHRKAFAFCGVLATASITIIQTAGNDTIRVIELCNNTKDFKLLSNVTITPNEAPKFSVTLPLTGGAGNIIYADSFECSIKRTCYGSVATN